MMTRQDLIETVIACELVEKGLKEKDVPRRRRELERLITQTALRRSFPVNAQVKGKVG